MKVIYKYRLPDETGKGKIALPQDNKPLYIGYDGEDKLCLWAEVDNKSDLKVYHVYILGTGWDLDRMYNGYSILDLPHYIGTTKDKFGQMWHVYME